MTEANLLDINWLRATGAEPQWFGLGFVQLKLNEAERLHFWMPNDGPIVDEEEVHDHRYGFTSHVLKGALTNAIFEFDYLSVDDKAAGRQHTHEMVKVSCDPHKKAPLQLAHKGFLREIGYQNLPTGSEYFVQKDSFHRTYVYEPTVTLLVRDEVEKEFARVVRKVGVAPVCAFSAPRSVEDCWTFVAKVLGDGSLPGYHLKDIERGVLGEASKIREEAEEFMDAVEQDVSIMALVELSDMIGAVEAYLAKHHPSVSLDDLRSMSAVTKRAFVNGRRG